MKRKKDPIGARSRILRAAEEVFARDGYARARTQEIADKASVNKAMLFYYFDSKERLFEATLEGLFAEIAEGVSSRILESALPSEERLDAFLGWFRDFWIAHPGLLRLMAASRKADPERHARLVEDRIRPLYEGVAERIEKGIARGSLQAVDARQFVFTMDSALRGYLREGPVGGDRPEARARHFDAGMAHLAYLVRASLFLPQPA